MDTNTASYVLHGLAVTVAGLGLALIGLGLARRDVAAVRAAGVNGLVLFLARSTVRGWWVRIAIQAALLAFSLSLLASPRVPLPPDADAWSVANVEFRRWLTVGIGALIGCASALDLWARHRAAEIAEGLHG